ncbi:MAG: EamA family transporter [Aeromicrobium sp.]
MRPVLFVVLSAVCFGTTGTAQVYGPDAASSTAVGLTRIVAGGALLGVVAWWVARRGVSRASSSWRSPRADGLVVLVAGAAVLAYQPAFFAGAHLNGVAIGAVVTIGAAPVLTGLLEWLQTRELPSRTWFVGTSAAVVGVVLLSGLLEGAGHDVSLPGLAGSLGAAASYAVYTVAAKRLLTAGWTPTASIGSIFATAAVLGAPFLLLVDLSWVGSPSGVAMIGWLAIVTVVIAYVLFATGLQSLSASTVSTLTLVEPLTACVLGLVLLDERLSAGGWTGLVVLLAGVVVLARPRPRPAEVPA